MGPLSEVTVGALSPQRFRPVLGDRYAEIEQGIVYARDLFSGRVVWHVNSTARGGGVAELLRSLLAYARGAGVDNRWVVIGADRRFFEITKRVHNHLHGWPGDDGPLGEDERKVYESGLRRNADELAALVRSRDVVFLHDPQTAGMVAPLQATGATVVWRCHVGLDLPNQLARGAWDFLRPYVEDADAYVFSRREFAWDGLSSERLWIVPPSIDAFSPKNQELGEKSIRAIAARAGIGTAHDSHESAFVRMDGAPGRVNRRAELDQDGAVPDAAPLVTQVSRWDRLKDPLGVLVAFGEHLEDRGAHLLLAGPAVNAVADDPEGEQVLAEVRQRRAEMSPSTRARVHLACLPMDDIDENAAMVNAIQRRSSVVVQKSLAEGFGLTVAEAMWKERPVVASRIGGIQDQIVDGESGLLLDDPADLARFGAMVDALLRDPGRRSAIGTAARRRVEERFLGSRHLIRYLELLAGLLDGQASPARPISATPRGRPRRTQARHR